MSRNGSDRPPGLLLIPRDAGDFTFNGIVECPFHSLRALDSTPSVAANLLARLSFLPFTETELF